MAVKSKAPVPRRDAPSTASLAAVMRDVREAGFAVIPEFIDTEDVEELRQECQSIMDAAERHERCGGDDHYLWIVRRGCIFPTIRSANVPWLPTRVHAFAAVRADWPCTLKACHILFSTKMLNLVVALLGKSACLFNDQYIVKPPRCGAASAFAWHCDKDWISAEDCEDTAYISVHTLACTWTYLESIRYAVWIALDDMTEDNGTLLVRRPSRIHDTSHNHQPLAKPPEVITVSAGSAVIMTSDLPHCSLPNNGSHVRRAYMPQFSAKPIHDQSGVPLALAVPILGLDI